jgi:hypothetical protein
MDLVIGDPFFSIEKLFSFLYRESIVFFHIEVLECILSL